MWKSTEWVLSNGIHVLLKPTTFKNDQILMSAFSPGGHSLVPDKDYLSAAMSAGILSQSGWAHYDVDSIAQEAVRAKSLRSARPSANSSKR